MDLALVVGLAVTVTLLAVTCALLAVVLAGSRRAGRSLDAARAEVAQLTTRIERMERTPRMAPPVVPESEYLITGVGTGRSDDAEADPAEVQTRFVVSSTLGEPLVKALAFAFGVRRALAPANRNRIRFEMRREVRLARKRRRRDALRKRRESARRPREAAV